MLKPKHAFPSVVAELVEGLEGGAIILDGKGPKVDPAGSASAEQAPAGKQPGPSLEPATARDGRSPGPCAENPPRSGSNGGGRNEP